jgi:hypothetical protein
MMAFWANPRVAKQRKRKVSGSFIVFKSKG